LAGNPIQQNFEPEKKCQTNVHAHESTEPIPRAAIVFRNLTKKKKNFFFLASKDNLMIAGQMEHMDRVTRLGEFSTLG
jgi:hypothetical protein